MTYVPEEHHRHSIRLKGCDYSQPGAYFITICIKERKRLLGEIENGNIILSPIGKIVHQCWKEIPNHFNNIKLDMFVIMPNHLHGIIIVTDSCRGVQLNAPTGDTPRDFYELISPKRKTLAVVIRTFKAAVTTRCQENYYRFFQWQRNYYEHVIRNEDRLDHIREYILNNPLQWQFDRENPGRIQDKAYYNQWGHLEGIIYGKTT